MENRPTKFCYRPMNDRLQAPVFLRSGELYDRVDLKHGTGLAAALRCKGVPVQWVSRSDEGHGFRRWDNKIALYRTFERFLAEHLR